VEGVDGPFSQFHDFILGRSWMDDQEVEAVYVANIIATRRKGQPYDCSYGGSTHTRVYDSDVPQYISNDYARCQAR
jgi:hypothetical protein